MIPFLGLTPKHKKSSEKHPSNEGSNKKIENIWEEKTKQLNKTKQLQSTLKKADDKDQQPHTRILPKRDKEVPLFGYPIPENGQP